MHTIEFTCQDCGADIVTSEDLCGVPVCVICRDTRLLEQEAKSARFDDAGMHHGPRHPLRRIRR
jgi:hypothetical protein